MKPFSTLAILLLLASSPALLADVKPKAPAAEEDKTEKAPAEEGEEKEAPAKGATLVGDWSGNTTESDDVITLHFTDDGALSMEKEGDENKVTGTYKLDTTKSPYHLDLILKMGDVEHAGYTIIEFDGKDAARIPEPADEKENRPTEFKDKVLTVKRLKKEKKTTSTESPADAKKLVGTWNGGDEGIVITMKADGTWSGNEGPELVKGTYKLDSSKSPMHLDLTLIHGDETETLLALIRFKDDDTFLMTEPEEERAENMEDVTTFKREK